MRCGLVLPITRIVCLLASLCLPPPIMQLQNQVENQEALLAEANANIERLSMEVRVTDVMEQASWCIIATSCRERD